MSEKTVQQEINEFRDAIVAYDPTHLGQSLRRMVDEGFDVVGKIINLDDDPANLSELADSISDAAQEFVDKALKGKPFARNGAKLGISMVAPSLVQEAAKYTGTVEQFWDEKVEPVLREVEETIHGIRLDMAG